MQVTGLKEIIAFATLGSLFLIGGCGSGGEETGDAWVPPGDTPPVADNPVPDPDPGDPTDPPSDPVPPPAHKNLFTPVSTTDWDETAVRKVLHAFAYGGQASDAQIQAWADMEPEFAVEQMLTFAEHNPLLSTPVLGDTDALLSRGGTLRELAEFWKSANPANGVTPEDREHYDISNSSGSLPLLWNRAVVSRGLNPFRQKIGFWETNYHMAVNRTTVAQLPMMKYYDDIMEAHEQGLPYQKVIAVAARSAAITLQYGLRGNRYRNGVCDCNEDFAREYHQLFFGILGDYDPVSHENITIKNTAKAFTDMTVHFDEITGSADFVDFGIFYHPPEALEILGTLIGGTNASERITEMVEVSINHPESLANLPIMIIRDLADDNLTPAKKTVIRQAWASMDEKNLLTFLRGYAMSSIFHTNNRYKFLTSFDRHWLIANLVGLSNKEHYLDLYRPTYSEESVQVFFPTHNVFGTQTGSEAASSDLVFRRNFNLATENLYRFRNPGGTAHGQDWEKDWARVVPANASENYVVEEVAEWLWNRFLADDLKNFGQLERAHVYALLAEDRDFAYLLDADNFDRVITANDTLADPAVITLINTLAGQIIDLDSPDNDDRQSANRRIGMAINFIVGTPFIFAQEGR